MRQRLPRVRLRLWIVEDQRGRINVASTVGKGTTFAVILPLPAAARQVV